eukprot:TRINITY_DN23009_c0_g1_i1.p1 TRINITY_DN23009_c0_g1~~TRINITY_DN23009_c0_g1_i1.p1  ORF type:complete len:233 (-),score=57.03 TRINITY_DN23009_c0_g1_i1:65-763(-)
MESSDSEGASDDGHPIRAVVVGATGATGKALVGQLLQDERYSRVTTIGRRPVPTEELSDKAGKLVQHTVDMDRVEEQKQLWDNHDVAFCCLGTTRSQAGSAEAFKRIDLHLVTKCGQIAKGAGVPHFSMVSSTGADAHSFFLYMKTKGQAEEAIKNLGFRRTSIWRPPLLGRGKDARLVEKIGAWFTGAMSVETVAAAMRNEAAAQLKDDKPGSWLYGTKQLNDWAAGRAML